MNLISPKIGKEIEKWTLECTAGLSAGGIITLEHTLEFLLACLFIPILLIDDGDEGR